MSSVLPGYEYDIFISYRQKDNKHDGWVTEFVEQLKGELEATFKEDISVYFDINPHDGLLETHDVAESLKEKLKSLVFIPVISRTYCDPNSYAWEHEFKAFIEQASKDQFGLKVKLPVGNIAGRVLPVQIHELDKDDRKLVEDELGGFLRSIEFIYKEPGVNRPLRSNEENPHANLNHAVYRNQINKVANAVKEIISGLKTEQGVAGTRTESTTDEPIQIKKKEKIEKRVEPSIPKKVKSWLWVAVLIPLLIVATIIFWPGIIKRGSLDNLISKDGRISIAVMPFQNMTADTLWNIWQDGIQNTIYNTLSASGDELDVKTIESVNSLIQSRKLTSYASFIPSMAGTISRTMGAKVFIFGNIQKTGTSIRINSQLVNSRTLEPIQPFQREAFSSLENMMNMSDSLSRMIRNYLVISTLNKGISLKFQPYQSTSSPEAFTNYVMANNSFNNHDWKPSNDYYLKAYKQDTNFIDALMGLTNSFGNLGLYKEAKFWCLKLREKMDVIPMPLDKKLWANFLYALYFETPYDRIKWLKQLVEMNDQEPDYHYSIALAYIHCQQYDKAIPEYVKALDIYRKWNTKPMWVFNYTGLGYAYMKTGQYNKAKKLYKRADKDFHDDENLITRQAQLALRMEDEINANKYIEKYNSIGKEKSWSVAGIKRGLATIYFEGGRMDQAEKYYKEALQLEPEDTTRIFNLAYFLIDSDRNVGEGMMMINKALEKNPNNYDFLHGKGWGLYKQGKFQEAREVLQKSSALREIYGWYNHDAYIHLEQAKKAAAQK